MSRKLSLPVGRPSKYEPRFCQMLVDHLSQGLSFETFGAIVDVCKETLYTWTRNYPEFLDAKKRGMLKCQLWWEKLGIDGVRGDNSNGVYYFNTAAWCFNMKNRFKWKDKHELMVEEVKPTMIKRLSGEVIELGVEQVGSNDDESDI